MSESLGESEVVVEMQVHTRANVSTAISSFNKLLQIFNLVETTVERCFRLLLLNSQGETNKTLK